MTVPRGGWRQVGILLACVLFVSPAFAQQDEDHQRVCPLLTEDLVRAVLPAVTGHGTCPVRCSGCGCKGGPGYRDAAGKCVGYSNLIQKCGPPPHTRCVAECAPVREGCDHGRVWLKNYLTAAGLSVRFVDGKAPLSPTQQQPLQRPNQSGDDKTQDRQNDDARE